ncbi:putative polypeptide-transport-associated domain protein FtsQ-type [Peptoclostridium acidaminophilum DSM 3953]|uniref:Putative polypeptide-transport-associated domain protein FtsQ-type n=1 Tax=Peptoclostridium acidaminophilum DSM 3953 TaxID=1286171 RepID=W8TJE6_PEPAC|nr:FtsQ-type POTRA domain-containing protein [Peptoclostridium acidaminophilum]AHM56347.1 putative polypeptide-transport-associated domain protein FtsQ-type [Peptoclostridium acidaminophilum DSM 3953]
MRRNIIMTSLVILVVAASSFYAAIMFGYFNVKDIEINGIIKLNKSELLKAANISKGGNIFLYDVSEIEKALLLNPYVKNASVKREFPDKLSVDIMERMELFCIPYMGSYVIIDEEGNVLRVENDINNLDRPILSGIEMENFKIGNKIKLGKKDVMPKLLELLNACSGSNILENISEIGIDKKGGIRLYTMTGVVVLLGDVQKLDYKIPLLKAILIDLYKKNINYGAIDMRYNGYPVYKQTLEGE